MMEWAREVFTDCEITRLRWWGLLYAFVCLLVTWYLKRPKKNGD